MKKSILATLVAIIGIAFSSHAQFGLGLDLGVKAGMAITSPSVSGTQTPGSEISVSGKTSYLGGAFAAVKFSRLAVQGELIFTEQSFELNSPGSNKETIGLTYFNIPLLVKFYLVDKEVLGITLFAGPQFGFRVNESYNDAIKNATSLNSTDISASVGAGLELPLGLRADVRYNHGLGKTLEQTGTDFSISQGVIQVAVGWSFL